MSEQAKKIIKPVTIISGPVGAGKTTISSKLVEISPGPLSYIEGDKFWFFIAKPTEEGSMIRNFRMIMASMTAAVVPYAMYGYEVILDFSAPPSFLETAQRILGAKEIPFNYIIIRPDIKICAARAASRKEGAIPDYEPYKRLYDSFDQAPDHILPIAEEDAPTIATKVRQAIDSGKFRFLHNTAVKQSHE